MSARWHIIDEGDTLTLCRHLPPRFDFSVRTRLEAGSRRALAHQIRQDLWRALQRLRGFSPVVSVRRDGGGWDVTAGGRAAAQVPASVVSRAQAVLDNPANRGRWQRHARKGAL